MDPIIGDHHNRRGSSSSKKNSIYNNNRSIIGGLEDIEEDDDDHMSNHNIGTMNDDGTARSSYADGSRSRYFDSIVVGSTHSTHQDDMMTMMSSGGSHSSKNHHHQDGGGGGGGHNQHNSINGDGSSSRSVNNGVGLGQSTKIQPWYRRRSRMLLVSVVALVLIVTLSTTIPKKKNKENTEEQQIGEENNSPPPITRNGPIIPASEVPQPVQITNQDAFTGSFLMELYIKYNIPNWSNALNDIDTPQGKAIKWITSRSNFQTMSSDIRIQRYALAVFYYSTFYQPHAYIVEDDVTDWIGSEHWITDLKECQWEGIVCDGSSKVTGILLSEHALTGTLPRELAFLTSLAELDLTYNYVYMEGSHLDLFIHMNSLRELRMEDNFVVCGDGIPTQFASLTSLEVLQMSYNLLQGQMLGTIFTSLQRLQHFEIESNYLTGSIPEEMGLLPDLLYLYARRNALRFRLEDLLTSSSSSTVLYPSLYSLWLDNNIIDGPIPTTIGTLTGLASLSISNATLTGTIPSQIGHLTGLRRVWLYDNELTGTLPTTIIQLNQLEVLELHQNSGLNGTMPSTICDYITGSDYKYRTLTADCDTLDCDCCTICY